MPFSPQRAPFNPFLMNARPVYAPSFGYASPRSAAPRPSPPQAFMASSDPTFSNQWWYPDSGASHHVTPDSSNVSDAHSVTGSEQVFMGNGQGLSINSIGSMNFTSPNFPHKPLTLHSLLLVPHITKNLISVSKFAQDNQVFFEFHPSFCLVKSQDSSEVLLRGVVEADGLYKFQSPSSQVSKFKSLSSLNSSVALGSNNCNPSTSCNTLLHSNAQSDCITDCTPSVSMNTSNVSCVNSPLVHATTFNNSQSPQHSIVPNIIPTSKYALWHTRLGHPHYQALAEVLKTCNIPIPPKSLAEFCTACCLGKSHRLPTSLSTIVYAQPFELVVCDLWGPAPIQSLGGYTYFLTCIDACSRFVWVFPLRLKSDTLTQFVQFKTMVELQFNCKIKVVQSDGGGEFRSFPKYLNNLGITHRFTCPHTHHQNGIVERKHRHIVETGLALLAHSNLPLKMWDHAFVTAAYLINRMPSMSLANQSPYFKLLHKIPDYSHLRVLGCACFPFLRPYNAHKLDYRSQECIFLGYSTIHKGYKCLAATGRIYISRDVLFNETRFPYSILFPSSSATSTSSPHTSSAWSIPAVPVSAIPLTSQFCSCYTHYLCFS